MSLGTNKADLGRPAARVCGRVHANPPVHRRNHAIQPHHRASPSNVAWSRSFKRMSRRHCKRWREGFCGNLDTRGGIVDKLRSDLTATVNLLLTVASSTTSYSAATYLEKLRLSQQNRVGNRGARAGQAVPACTAWPIVYVQNGNAMVFGQQQSSQLAASVARPFADHTRVAA